ncbi:MAG: fructose 1,6-bisphosphatase [Olleya sp.]
MAKTDKTNEETAHKSAEAASKIDAIKQLIFGENMQAYDSEFETLKKDILNKKQELEALMDEVKSELLQNIDNLSTDINIRITELENTFEDKADALNQNKVDRKLLGELFTKLGEKISQ